MGRISEAEARRSESASVGAYPAKTHARTWAFLGFYPAFIYHMGTRPDSSAIPTLYEIGTVLAITALGYLVGWLIGKWVGEPDGADSVCEAEMLLLVGDEDVTHVTQDTVDRDRAVV